MATNIFTAGKHAKNFFDISNNTLSIDSVKLEAIYGECIKVVSKQFISKRFLQFLLALSPSTSEAGVRFPAWP